MDKVQKQNKTKQKERIWAKFCETAHCHIILSKMKIFCAENLKNDLRTMENKHILYKT